MYHNRGIMKKSKIGEILVKGGAINKKQLEYALQKQEEEGGKLGEILIKLGYINDSILIKALTEQVNEDTFE